MSKLYKSIVFVGANPCPVAEVFTTTKKVLGTYTTEQEAFNTGRNYYYSEPNVFGYMVEPVEGANEAN